MRRGSVATDSNMAYFHGDGSTTVHSYDSNTREWRRLPATPHKFSTLVVVHYVLTMVGGQISGGATDSLLSPMGEGRDIKWLPNLPAMPTKRYETAAVCSGRSLIVAGGDNGRNILSTVEVLDTDTRQWSIASSLIYPISDATVVKGCTCWVAMMIRLAAGHALSSAAPSQNCSSPASHSLQYGSVCYKQHQPTSLQYGSV